jgi:hypothetical protein
MDSDVNAASEYQRERGGCVAWLLIAGLVALFAYVPSSGPVLASAFWLREATGWDGFYSVMWLYYPLIVWTRETPLQEPIHQYIEWWVELFGTVGPG